MPLELTNPLPPLIDRGGHYQPPQGDAVNQYRSGPAIKRIDYVLVYPDGLDPASISDSEREQHKKNRRYRAKFEKACLAAGLELEKEPFGENVFVKVHCPFSRLSEEAEHVKIEMNLNNVIISPTNLI